MDAACSINKSSDESNKTGKASIENDDKVSVKDNPSKIADSLEALSPNLGNEISENLVADSVIPGNEITESLVADSVNPGNEISESLVANSRNSGNEIIESLATDSVNPGNEITESLVADSRNSGNEIIESLATDSVNPGNEITESLATDSVNPGNEITESLVADSRNSGNETSESFVAREVNPSSKKVDSLPIRIENVKVEPPDDIVLLSENEVSNNIAVLSHNSLTDKTSINSAEEDFVKTILKWNEQQVGNSMSAKCSAQDVSSDTPITAQDVSSEDPLSVQDVPNEDPSSVQDISSEDPSSVQEVPNDDPTTCHVVFEVGIQANDYEIERRSGKVPTRKRLVPFKFRDYRNPDNLDPDQSDSDYDPQEDIKIRKRRRSVTGRAKKESSEDDTGKSVLSDKLNGSRKEGFPCDLCSKVFTQKGNLKVHRKLHTADRPFPCNEEHCGKSFRSNETLRRHKLTHIGVKPFTCEVCHNKFSSKVSLTEHQSRHNDTKPYTCDKCGKSFRQVSCYKRHLVTHTTVTPYTCSLCGKKFSQMAYLRSHNKVHTGEKPFSCDMCNKSFAHGSDLTRHKIIHSGKKPYRCTHCSHQFSDASSCRRHIREHSQSKPYTCNLCGDGFKRTGQLRAHLARKHFSKDDDIIKTEPIESTELHKGSDNPGILDISSSESQRKIVSLIKNLNSNIVVQEIEIANPETGTNAAGQTMYVEEINVTNITDNDLVQLSEAVETSVNQLEIPIQELPEIASDGTNEKTVITITDGSAKSGASLPFETYQIIQGLAEHSNNEQQIYEVHYQNEVPNKSNNPAVPTDTESAPDYVANPDFASQEYYNWLSNFTELCKMMPMPLDVSLFQKMSQVHKTLSDVMATPSGVVADKENFRVLMTISRDLNLIISEHLNFVLHNLDEEKMPS